MRRAAPATAGGCLASSLRAVPGEAVTSALHDRRARPRPRSRMVALPQQRDVSQRAGTDRTGSRAWSDHGDLSPPCGLDRAGRERVATLRPVAPLARLAGTLLPGSRLRRRQVAAYARAWQEHDATVPGPVWAVLGDSTAQGVGASAHGRGYVGLLAAHMPELRVRNLSVSGARIGDVVRYQLPQLSALEPSLVTCAVGANDLLRTRSVESITAALHELLAGLPPGAVVATLPRGIRERAAERLNDLIWAAAPARGLRVADVWAHTGPPWRGKYARDGFHPSDRGYPDWAAAFLQVLDLDGDPAAP